MRKAEIIVAFFFVAIGIIAIVDAARVGFGWGPSGPESGFFPFYLGVGTLICSAVVLVKGFREPTAANLAAALEKMRRVVVTTAGGAAEERLRLLEAEAGRMAGKDRLIPEGGLKPILWVLLPSTGMVILTEFVGLHIAAAIFLAFYMRAVGKIRWVTIALVSILLPVCLFVVFDKLFLIPLPTGLWGSKLIPF
jgi:hypothetical protein